MRGIDGLRTAFVFLLMAGAALAGPRVAVAQGRAVPPPSPEQDSVTVVAGPRYEAGAFRRWVLGSDWRDLWNTAITLPVLDIEQFAGGLEPQREGGNRQSITLHMVAADGHGWIFRSLDKYPSEKLDFDGLLEAVIQDQVSALHPGGQLVVPRLLEALEILHVAPEIYVMPDDPALGRFRERFAGMVGALELKPNEGEDETPGWAGSTRIVATDRMLERMEESAVDRVDQRELLRARLVDFIIGDPDRASDQWRWARFPHPDHPDRTLWRPIPRDRDWVFVSADGLIPYGIRMFYPKLTRYEPNHASISANTFSTHLVDRQMLTELARADVLAEVATVQSRLTDAVVEEAVSNLPDSYPENHLRRLAETIRARRDGLERIAVRFYGWLATDVGVRGTDERDRAEVVRKEDGTVLVTLQSILPGDTPSQPYYERMFRPDETREVRVFLHGDDDVAIVRGGPGTIRIRILGGGGDDVLADSSGFGRVYLYDDRGDNRLIESRGTEIDTREWDAPAIHEGINIGGDWAPDYGGGLGWTPAHDFGEYGGVILGVGPSWTRYGFRRLPYHWSAHVTPLYATGANRVGVRGALDYRFENSLSSIEAKAGWSGFDAIRWFGLGNDTELVQEQLSLVPMDRTSLEASLVLRYGAWRADHEGEDVAEEGEEAEIVDLGVTAATPPGVRVRLAFGPVAYYTDPRSRDFGPFALQEPVGADATWQVGARASVRMERVDRPSAPHRGFRLDATARAFPGLDDDVGGAFGNIDLLGRGYLPVRGDAHLAVRLGLGQAWGDFPAWHAPALGGRSSLRGFEFMRYAGETAAFGGAELRVPLTEIALLFRGHLGVLGLVDTGRVWVGGASPGGWHIGGGGGLWFEGLGRAISVYFATGERDQLYLSFGMPF